jgi:hypothetical protein
MLSLGVVSGSALANEAQVALMKLIPGGADIVITASDLATLDQSLSEMVKKIDPNSGQTNLLAGIKEAIMIGDWIDFSKPMAIAMPKSSNDDLIMFFAHVADFESKMKGLEGAKKEGDTWSVEPAADSTDPAMYATTRGDIVVGTVDKALLENIGKAPLVERWSKLPDDIRARPLQLHINMEGVKGQVTQALGAYGPMIGMMAGAQGGDPQAMAGMMNALVEAATSLVNQSQSLTIGLNFSPDGADATVAALFGDGEIKSYLSRQKPATMPMFTSLPDMPYFVAFGFHIPGDEAPFWSYVMDKMGAMPAPAPAAGGAEGGEAGGETGGQAEDADAPDKDAMLKSMKKLYAQAQGGDAIIFFGPGGFGEIGQWVSSNPSETLAIVEEIIANSDAMMPQFGMGGMQYKSLGKKKIGSAEVSAYSIAVDTSNPQAAMMAMFYGPNSEFAMGQQGERLRFGLGSPEVVSKAFAAGHEKILSDSKYVKEALAALPKNRNAVVLLDIGSLLPMVGPMMGMPPIAELPDGPPFAFSMSFAGEPARLDIHVPVAAIARITQAMSPAEPM